MNRGGGRMKRNLKTQKKFFFGLNDFPPFHKNYALHDLGPGHPGTHVINQNEVYCNKIKKYS